MNIAIIGATGMIGARTAAEAILPRPSGRRLHPLRQGTRRRYRPQHRPRRHRGTGRHRQQPRRHHCCRPGRSRHLRAAGHRRTPRTDRGAPTGRLLVVGGAGSLEDGNGNRFVDGEGFPEDYKPEAKAFAQILDEYRASEGLNWTILSPAFEIAPGERTGKYNTATGHPCR